MSLLKDVKEAFDGDPRQFGLSFTAPTSYWYLRWFKIEQLWRYVNWINLMTYDLSVSTIHVESCHVSYCGDTVVTEAGIRQTATSAVLSMRTLTRQRSTMHSRCFGATTSLPTALISASDSMDVLMNWKVLIVADLVVLSSHLAWQAPAQ